MFIKMLNRPRLGPIKIILSKLFNIIYIWIIKYSFDYKIINLYFRQERKFIFDKETSCSTCDPYNDKITTINIVATAVYGIVNNLFNTRPSFAGKIVLFRKIWYPEYYIQNEKMNQSENAVHHHLLLLVGNPPDVADVDVYPISIRVQTNLYLALGSQLQKKRNHFCKIVVTILRSLLRNIVQLRRHFMIIWWLKESLIYFLPSISSISYIMITSKSVYSLVVKNYLDISRILGLVK